MADDDPRQTHPERPEPAEQGDRDDMAGASIAVGLALGVALGVALDNIAIGIAIGLAIGATGVFAQRRGG